MSSAPVRTVSRSLGRASTKTDPAMSVQIFVLRVDTMTDKHVAFTPLAPTEHQESYTSLAEAVGLLVLAQSEVLGLEVMPRRRNLWVNRYAPMAAGSSARAAREPDAG
jgi:hypothetical protein